MAGGEKRFPVRYSSNAGGENDLQRQFDPRNTFTVLKIWVCLFPQSFLKVSSTEKSLQ
jgi:hypothetical protein